MATIIMLGYFCTDDLPARVLLEEEEQQYALISDQFTLQPTVSSEVCTTKVI